MASPAANNPAPKSAIGAAAMEKMNPIIVVPNMNHKIIIKMPDETAQISPTIQRPIKPMAKPQLETPTQMVPITTNSEPTMWFIKSPL